MEQRARRWLTWSAIILTLLISLLSGALALYWHAKWPFPSAFVINTSPWIEPQLRALGKLEEGEWVSFSKVPWHANKIGQEIGDRREEAVAAFLVCLRSSNQRLRGVMLEMVEYLPEEVMQSVELRQEIVRMTADPDHGMRNAAFMAVCEFPADAPEIVPTLRANLDYLFRHDQDFDYFLLHQAMPHLCSPGDADLIPRILPVLEDSSLRVLAIDWLGRIGDARVASAIQRWTEDADPQVRQEAREVLKKFSRGRQVE